MTDKTLKTVNPLTEQVLKTYPRMSDDEAMDVVQNCHDAFLDWRLQSLDERAAVISAIAEELRKSKDEFARLMTDEIAGMESAESELLLKTLFDHVESDEFVYEHTWRVGDLSIWDNRCVLHARTDFDPAELRLLRRFCVIGDVPF